MTVNILKKKFWRFWQYS